MFFLTFISLSNLKGLSSIFFKHTHFLSKKRFCIPKGKCLFTGTVPVNKNYHTGTVPVNKNYPTGTVPVNKNYPTGTEHVNKNYLTGKLINKLTILSSEGVLKL